ncbi:SAM-dependent methyltransferase [Kitasatospora sp. MAP12-15]|nr:SAM-dependent methyltransferase [Kitasatospora sp. MAP12-44]
MSGRRNKGHGDIAASGSHASAIPIPEGMAAFDDIYDQPDPRAYFRALGPLEYQAPHHGQSIFQRAVAARRRTARAAEPVTVLDICCSYGINAALLNHDVTLDDLYAHYTSPQATALTTAELIEWDRSYYAARRRRDPARVIGLDMATNAISYAREVGLLDEGFAENLETAPPSPSLLRAARHARLITITGGATFLSPRTFQPILTCAHDPVWVAAFVLRTTSYASIAACLASYGLVTEKATTHTFRQRRFTDADEQRYAVKAVTAAGDDPYGKETDGYFHTTLHLSRPSEDVTALQLTDLMPSL